MSHNNMVVLHGTFHVVKSRIIEHEGRKFPEVEAMIETGPKSYGGIHKVSLMSVAAERAKTFVEANRGDGMLVTASGWLYSVGDNSRVVVTKITFYVPMHIAEKAKSKLKMLGSYHGEMGPMP